MKELNLKNVKPGMILAAPVLSSDGKTLGTEGQEITAALLNKFAFYSIGTLYVRDADDQKQEQPVQKGNVQNPTYSQRIKQSEEFRLFQLEYSKHMAACQQTFSNIESGGFLDVDDCYDRTRQLMKTMRTTIQIFDMLHNIRQVNDSVYAHCLNVALISFSMGTWLKFGEHDLKILTVAGLLHDIGKIQIPPEILNKPGKYTDEEFELVKSHPKLGYNILKDLDIDDRIKKVALMHHERCDGTGYPAGIHTEYINDFSLIVAIADVYDAMTAARTYRSPLCPFQVIESFEKEGLHKYKPKYILTFLKRIANAYQSNRVILSNGKSGNIVLINDKNLSKPILEMTDGSFLDLSTQHDVSIVSIL
ncbi:MAG: HD-GYP domain-containing protein [Lachnospiraceae bacterium]